MVSILCSVKGISMKWYEQTYVNHRDWVLQNLQYLGMSSEETVIVLMIDFMNEHQQEITMETLAKKTGFTSDDIDRIISVLCAKKYLNIKASSSHIRFSLDSLFETDTARDERVLDSSLFDVFETEIGRPLTSREMQKIGDWTKSTDKQLIIYALREASAYQSVSLPYIDTILKKWKESGVTAASLEKEKK